MSEMESQKSRLFSNFSDKIDSKTGLSSISLMFKLVFAFVGLVFAAELVYSTLSYAKVGSYLTEISKKTKAMDTASWSLWSTTYYQAIADTNRLVRDGLIDRDFFAEYGVSDVVAYSAE